MRPNVYRYRGTTVSTFKGLGPRVRRGLLGSDTASERLLRGCYHLTDPSAAGFESTRVGSRIGVLSGRVLAPTLVPADLREWNEIGSNAEITALADGMWNIRLPSTSGSYIAHQNTLSSSAHSFGWEFRKTPGTSETGTITIIFSTGVGTFNSSVVWQGLPPEEWTELPTTVPNPGNNTLGVYDIGGAEIQVRKRVRVTNTADPVDPTLYPADAPAGYTPPDYRSGFGLNWLAVMGGAELQAPNDITEWVDGTGTASDNGDDTYTITDTDVQYDFASISTNGTLALQAKVIAGTATSATSIGYEAGGAQVGTPFTGDSIGSDWTEVDAFVASGTAHDGVQIDVETGVSIAVRYVRPTPTSSRFPAFAPGSAAGTIYGPDSVVVSGIDWSQIRALLVVGILYHCDGPEHPVALDARLFQADDLTAYTPGNVMLAGSSFSPQIASGVEMLANVSTVALAEWDGAEIALTVDDSGRNAASETDGPSGDLRIACAPAGGKEGQMAIAVVGIPADYTDAQMALCVTAATRAGLAEAGRGWVA